VAQTTVHQALVERTLRDHLKAWLPSHLRRVAVENGKPPRALGDPTKWSWPVASEFDLKPQERLPAVFIVANGKTGAGDRGPNGWRATWSCEVAVAVAAQGEETARELAGMLLAAVETALLWHPTLGGLCEHITWGTQDLAVGRAGGGTRSHRAVFGAQFDLVIPAALARRPPEEPSTPPTDPYEPPDIPPPLEEADITVTAEELTTE
jgi:hypothetical protein